MAVTKRKQIWFLDKLTEPDSEKGKSRVTIPDSVCEKNFRETKQKERECR